MSSGKATTLAPSRKFYISSEHEVVKGRFIILDRYIEDGRVMLKFEWITGEYAGTIECKKESTINQRLFKYNHFQNKPTWQAEAPTTLADIHKMLLDEREATERLEHKLEAMNEVITAQGDMISRLVTALTK